MSDAQLENVDFEIIRYANCWEDADVLLEALDIDNDSEVMSIASAGDNSFSIASKGARKVVAVDVSLVQLHLVELKKAAIKKLDRQSYMGFAGFVEDPNRQKVYLSIRSELSEPCRLYWDQKTKEIEEGIIHIGKFERYFQLFKTDYLHTVHSQELIDQLFEEKSEEDQIKFHNEVWHTKEWEKLYKFYFGRQMLGDKGRDPEFLKYVDGDVAELNLEKAMGHLKSVAAQSNYFLQYILNNQFTDFLPHYVRKENYDSVRKNIDSIILHHGLLDSAIQEHPNCSHFNLSDIFEYMDVDLFEEVGKQVVNGSSSNAKIVYWNLLIDRNIATILPTDVNSEKVEKIKAKDKGYFYKSFILNTKV